MVHHTLVLPPPPTFSFSSLPLQKYVQDALREQLAETVYHCLREEGGHIYVCGDVTMAGDVLKTVQHIIKQQGNMSLEDAGFFISRLRVRNAPLLPSSPFLLFSLILYPAAGVSRMRTATTRTFSALPYGLMRSPTGCAPSPSPTSRKTRRTQMSKQCCSQCLKTEHQTLDIARTCSFITFSYKLFFFLQVFRENYALKTKKVSQTFPELLTFGI